MTTELSPSEMVELVMEKFRFDRVHAAMVAVDWKWGCGDNCSVPDVEKLKDQAKWLLQEAIKDGSKVSTGGFDAIYDEGILTLEFIFESENTSDE